MFSIAVKNLKINIITLPDNSGAANFFKGKLKFQLLNPSNNGLSSRYKDYLIFPYPRAKNMLKTIAVNYPRVVMPELIGRYESLKFKSNMGKSISKKDVSVKAITLNYLLILLI